MSKKIAPMVIEAVEAYWLSGETEEGKQARAELRALLAVARAAKFWVDRREAASMLLPPECWKELDKGTMRAIRALARLSRVSGGKP